MQLEYFDPLEFQTWLKAHECKPKTKGHLKAFVNRMFNKAKLYGMFWFVENPIKLVEVRGISKRKKKQPDLTIEQCFLVLGLLPEPYHTMAFSALCTGLRIEEVLAQTWDRIDFERLCMKVEEAVVHGRIGPVKSEYSDDELPLDPEFADLAARLETGEQGSGLGPRISEPRHRTMLPCFAAAAGLDSAGGILSGRMPGMCGGSRRPLYRFLDPQPQAASHWGTYCAARGGHGGGFWQHRLAHIPPQVRDSAAGRGHSSRRAAAAHAARRHPHHDAVRRGADGESADGQQPSRPADSGKADRCGMRPKNRKGATGRPRWVEIGLKSGWSVT